MKGRLMAMRRGVTKWAAALVLAAAGPAAAQDNAARLTVTQRALVVQCLDGAAVGAGRRSWTISAPVTLAVTMRNRPRTGVANAEPGTAIVRFTPDAGHRYEVEVRADAASFSRRVWTTGTWAPVVRDRTTDQVVSGDPEWAAPPCTPQAR
jgi:hypothetical protein